MFTPEMPDIRKNLPKGAKPIHPSSSAHEGINVPELVDRCGDRIAHFKTMPPVLGMMGKTLMRGIRSYKSLKQSTFLPPMEAPAALIEELEAIASREGCLDVGWTRVDPSMIFSNKVIAYDNAMILSLEMKRESLMKAPSIETGKEVWRTYAELGRIVNLIASRIRKAGFAAEASPSLGGDVNYPLLAQKAGMGAIGKNGLLISPGAGPSQRLAAVLMNITNIPLTESRKTGHKWIEDYCEDCRRCISVCPAQAIHPEPVKLKQGGVQQIDNAKCALPFSRTIGCSVCIRECPIFTNGYETSSRDYLSS